MPHLFVDISAHGFGHLAQTAPVLNRLHELLPDLRLTVRSGLPLDKLRSRLHLPFAHSAAASDFGFTMIDALRIDHAATTAAYRAAHVDFPGRIAAEARLFIERGVDAVFSNVAYLPLAGARAAGLPALAMCSLNWADLCAHFYGNDDWAKPILAEIRAAYNAAPFLRTSPGMAMPALENVIDIGAIAARGTDRRAELCTRIGADSAKRLVLVGLGGIPSRLPVERWPALPGTHWLVPADWRPVRTGFHALEEIEMSFTDLLRSVDAVVTKPGYGTFAEAACNGTAVLYQRREDWPEQDSLIAWLQRHARCREVSAAELADGNLEQSLSSCLGDSVSPASTFGIFPADYSGAETAARHLAGLLAGKTSA